MIINLLLGFNLFVSSSVPLGTTSMNVPSGFSVMVGAKYKVNYDFMVSYYKKSNYETKLQGLLIGKDFFLGKSFTILPEIGLMRGERSRKGISEKGFSPLFLIRFAYLFPPEESNFQIGFSLREVFNGKKSVDFFDIGIGFRM